MDGLLCCFGSVRPSVRDGWHRQTPEGGLPARCLRLAHSLARSVGRSFAGHRPLTLSLSHSVSLSLCLSVLFCDSHRSVPVGRSVGLPCCSTAGEGAIGERSKRFRFRFYLFRSFLHVDCLDLRGPSAWNVVVIIRY